MSHDVWHELRGVIDYNVLTYRDALLQALEVIEMDRRESAQSQNKDGHPALFADLKIAPRPMVSSRVDRRGDICIKSIYSTTVNVPAPRTVRRK
jgi:hypothetical protein